MTSKQLNPRLPSIYKDRNSIQNAELSTVPSLECQHPLSLSPGSQQATPYEVDEKFLALIHIVPVESHMPVMDMEELLSFLQDTPGFTFDKEDTETQQSTNSGNASPSFSQALCPRAGEILVETPTIDNAILARTDRGEQSPSYFDLSFFDQPNGRKSPTIMLPSRHPVAGFSQAQLCPPANPTQNQYLSVPQFEQVESKIIQIICQPRSKYRPRTQNESRTSAHYIRCEDGAEHDHPAIKLPRFWMHRSRTNYIEVTLVDTEKLPHPYDLRNKTSKSSFKDEASIVQQNHKNVLYFRLTNEDFVTGFKTFMIELIKGKQDDVITKKVIQHRKLNQSMLRFTRLFIDETGELKSDMESVAYSDVLTENYGEVSVEHISPRFGLMDEEEMVFILLKGRVLKDALTVVLSERTTRYSHTVRNITLNGTVAYFPMPPWTRSHADKVIVDISVYYQNDLLQQSPYTYLALPDQHLIEADRPISPAIAKKPTQSNRLKRLRNKRKTF